MTIAIALFIFGVPVTAGILTVRMGFRVLDEVKAFLS